jgi:hypothetical protein
MKLSVSRPLLVFLFSGAAGALSIALSSVAVAQDFERPPIEYSLATPENCVSQLQSRIDSGEAKLEFSNDLGYLTSVLAALKVPHESQMLVFSKTSLQRQRISPATPRAIYFNDDVYVGFCQSGNVLEISAADPQLGAVFYTLDQRPEENPRFTRQTDNCLICHSSSRTDGVPGHVARSLLVDRSGDPRFSSVSYSVNHTTPLERRWGGWYVTGTHGAQKHLGNLIVRGRDAPEAIENIAGRNVTTLADRFTVARYLTPHSDIVALMVLEHQILVHNRLARANYAVRQALFYETEFNRERGEPENTRLEITTRSIQLAGDELVEAMLLVEEAQLTATIRGTSDYAEIFAQAGPRDSQGRSLRELDLKRRLFRYPCSYLIYSQAFDQLPPEMSDYVWQRLWDVLVNEKDAQKFAHLTSEDRQAIVEIIRDTKRNAPAFWQEKIEITP